MKYILHWNLYFINLICHTFFLGARFSPIGDDCTPSNWTAGDGLDNDCDNLIDEELGNGIDDDGDGLLGMHECCAVHLFYEV